MKNRHNVAWPPLIKVEDISYIPWNFLLSFLYGSNFHLGWDGEKVELSWSFWILWELVMPDDHIEYDINKQTKMKI